MHVLEVGSHKMLHTIPPFFNINMLFYLVYELK